MTITDLRQRGEHTIRLRKGSKKPFVEAWTTNPPDEPQTFLPGENVGLGNGIEITPGRFTADFDLDWPEAREAADLLALSTDFVFGKPSTPHSHRGYTTDTPIKSRSYKFGQKEVMKLMGERSQCMAPPSVHPSGEVLTFDAFGERGHYATDALTDSATLAQFEKGEPITSSLDDAVLVRTLRRWFRASYRDDGQTINVTDTSQAMIDRAWEALANANEPPGLFVRGADVVMVPHGPQTCLSDAYKRQLALRREHNTALLPGFQVVSGDTFRDIVGRLTPCVRIVKNTPMACAPTTDFANLMLASPFKGGLPVVKGFSRVPFFAPDGSLVTTPGLHDETQMFYWPDASLVLPDVPLAPTCDDITRALAQLDELLWQFPFADREWPWDGLTCVPDDYRRTAYANALAFPLTVLLRGYIDDIVPLFLFDKPTSRTGATLMVQALSYITLGEWPAARAWDKSQSERRKMLTATLMTGTPIFFLDEVEDLFSGDLNKILTSKGGREDRKLGVSELISIENASVFAATGNNPRYPRDMGGRIVKCRLDAGVSRPEDRSGFAINIRTWVPAHRSALLHALYVLIQAALAKGSLDWTTRTLAGFENWSRAVGGVLDVAGLGDHFLNNRSEVMDDAEDDEESFDGAFLEEWVTTHQSSWIRAKELLTLSALPEENGVRWGVGQLGPYLKKSRDKWLPLDDGTREVRIERHEKRYRLRVRSR